MKVRVAGKERQETGVEESANTSCIENRGIVIRCTPGMSCYLAAPNRKQKSAIENRSAVLCNDTKRRSFKISFPTRCCEMPGTNLSFAILHFA
jgi:hypothetical protein